MRGRHEHATGPRAGLRWLAGLLGLAVGVVVLLAMSPASAAPTTLNAQLSLTGIATKANLTGGSQVGIHPGDSVDFTAATVPTAGLDNIGLGNLVNTLLSVITSYKVDVDFSHLPGGHADTVLTNKTHVKFTFPKAGTYNFTWSAKVLGLAGLPIKLDGNQLKQAGVKLNAQNQYVGQVVVSNNPPPGGISVQLPTVKVAPSLPVVGQLPTITVPGVTLPTLAVPSVPNLAPSSGPSGSHTGGGGKHSSGGQKGGGSRPTGVTIPEKVVPKGDGDAVFGGGGVFNGVLPNVAPLNVGALHPAAPKSSAAPAPAATSAAAQQKPASKHKTVEVAAKGTPSAQLPVVLAIVAIIALSLVAATYARLFLLRREAPTSAK